MDVYTMVTERILKELENGNIPWLRPWCCVSRGAFNRISGRRYGMMNQLLLKHDGEYATFNQWTKLGGQIRKGEKSELVVFWKMPELKEDDHADEKTDKDVQKHPVLRYYRVFHISQVDGVIPLPAETLYDTDPIEGAESILQEYLNRERIGFLNENPNEAFYNPQGDYINLPERRQFRNAIEYYSTAYHEAVHSTGNCKRLDREGLKKISFGSELYSKEELIAEIGSAAMLHHLGIDTDQSIRNSAAYIQNWLNVLQADKRMIVSAAAKAEKAVRFILNEENEM